MQIVSLLATRIASVYRIAGMEQCLALSRWAGSFDPRRRAPICSHREFEGVHACNPNALLQFVDDAVDDMAAEFSSLRKGCAERDDLRFAMIGIWQRFYPAPLRECLENLAHGLTADTQVPGDVRRALSASSDVDDNERPHARRTGKIGRAQD